MSVETQTGELTASQRAAILYLTENEEAVADSLFKYALEQAQLSYYADGLPDLEDCTGQQQTARARLDQVEGFQEIIELCGVTILLQDRDGVSYVAFDFETPLDPEHGFSVLTHRDKPLGFAGAGEAGGGPPDDERVGSADLRPLDEVVRYIKELHSLLKSVKKNADIVAIKNSLAVPVQVFASFKPDHESLDDPRYMRLGGAIIDEMLRIREKHPMAAEELNDVLSMLPVWRKM